MPLFKIYFQWEVYQINILFKCWITGSKTSFFCWNWDQRQVSQPSKGISRIQEYIWHKNCSCYDLTIKCSQFDILLQKQWFLFFLDYDILMWQSFPITHKELTVLWTLWEKLVLDREAWRAAVQWGSQRVRHDRATELNWTEKQMLFKDTERTLMLKIRSVLWAMLRNPWVDT